MMLRAVWPIIDTRRRLDDLINEAAPELLLIAAREHARITGPGHWRIEQSAALAGFPRVTELALVYDAPAVSHRRTNLPAIIRERDRRGPRLDYDEAVHA